MKIAVITGGALGLGRALAERLDATKNYKVIILDIIEPKHLPSSIEFYKCDMTKTFKQVFESIYEKHGRIDILVNNAGSASKTNYFADKTSLDAKIESNNKLIALNLSSVINATQIAIDYMVKQKEGVIINIASMAGLIPLSPDPVYTATKHGVVGLSTSLGHLDKKGVRVVAICPFFFETDLLKSGKEKSEFFKKAVSKLPFIKIEEVVDACVLGIEDTSVYGKCIAVTPIGIKVMRDIKFEHLSARL